MGRDRDRQRGQGRGGQGRNRRDEGRERERGGGLGDRPDAAGDGMNEQEFRQRIRDRLDGIDERIAHMAERLDRLER